MGALRIECYLDEAQMSSILDRISNTLYRINKWDLEDIDFVLDFPEIRVIVDFNISFDVTVKDAVIQDRYYNDIEADTAVFKQRVSKLVKGWNESIKELEQQQLEY